MEPLLRTIGKEILANRSLLEMMLVFKPEAVKPSERELQDKADAEEERRYDWGHTDYEPDDIDDDN